MFPRREYATLRRLARLAVAMARKGQPAAGYVSLCCGLGRAMALRDAGEPWGETLVAQYQRTQDEYAHRYEVARE